MKIWPQIQAKMALTQFSPIAGYYHGVLAATVPVLEKNSSIFSRIVCMIDSNLSVILGPLLVVSL